MWDVLFQYPMSDDQSSSTFSWVKPRHGEVNITVVIDNLLGVSYSLCAIINIFFDYGLKNCLLNTLPSSQRCNPLVSPLLFSCILLARFGSLCHPVHHLFVFSWGISLHFSLPRSWNGELLHYIKILIRMVILSSRTNIHGIGYISC